VARPCLEVPPVPQVVPPRERLFLLVHLDGRHVAQDQVGVLRVGSRTMLATSTDEVNLAFTK